MYLRIIETTEELQTLEKDWNALLRSTENNEAHLTHEWMVAWWNSFGNGNRLHIMAIYDPGDQIIGILPCMQAAYRYCGLNVTSISLAVNGYSPSSTVIARERDMDRVVRAALAYFEGRPSWDVLNFHKIKKNGAFHGTLREQMQSGGRYGTSENIESPYILMNTDWDGFMRARSAKFRKAMRNKINRIKRCGDVTVERLAIPDGSDAAVQDMIGVSGKSWKKRIGADLVTHTQGRTFLSELCDRLGPQGFVHLWMLKKSGLPIAYEFQLAYNNVIYPIRADYDERFGSLSPGSYLEYRILKTLFEESKSLVYYTCGHTYHYLLRWTDRTSKHVNVDLFNKNTLSHSMHALSYRIMPVLRKIKSRGPCA